MAYVCAELSTEQPLMCAVWVQEQSLLPQLSTADALLVSGAIITVCVVAFAFRTLFEFVKKLK